jgi:hypothetical protein
MYNAVASGSKVQNATDWRSYVENAIHSRSDVRNVTDSIGSVQKDAYSEKFKRHWFKK